MTISVIIPALNERDGLPETVKHLREAFRGEALTAPEIIVVDGGSTDGTREWVQGQPGLHLWNSVRGRGPQMNAGARAAQGDVLLFLHADCGLPPGAGAAIQNALADPNVVGGAFRARFDAGSPRALRLTASMITLRSRLFHEATGDQAIWARKEAFWNVQGFPEWPLFEDFALVARLKKCGRFQILPLAVTLAPRRWLIYGIGRTNALMCLLYFGYRFGIAPATLKRWFADVRPSAGVTGDKLAARQTSSGHEAADSRRP
jgi:rSAM/selenodomain-associated transferase 2